jgi:uncharacterized membrane-anchored protein YitT (DUF2179 family)
VETNAAKLTHQKLSVGKILKRILFILIGAALVSVGLEIFLVPNHIIDGGIVGISIILSHVSAHRL